MEIDISKIKAYYINLDEEINRRASTEKILSNIGSDFSRVSGVKLDNRRGCSLSHISALETAIKAGQFPFLIVEDDIVRRTEYSNLIIHEDTDALFLGLSRAGRSTVSNELENTEHLQISEKNDETHRVHNMLAAHAVVYFNQKFAVAVMNQRKKFLRNVEKYKGGDLACTLMYSSFKVLALNNPMFYQHSEERCTNVSIDDVAYEVLD